MATPAPTWPPLPPVADWPGDTAPLPAPILRGRSQWIPVRWNELPGVGQDALHEAWNAWMRSCERPGSTWAQLCAEVRRLSIATLEEQRAWMIARLQPYRIQPLPGQPPSEGLLTRCGSSGTVVRNQTTPRAPCCQTAWPCASCASPVTRAILPRTSFPA